jgi:hypothetical protein
MAGKIVADTLEHSTAGSLSTQYVVEGSSKAWVNFDGTGTIAARDSLNLSSLTDVGTARYKITVGSAFGNSDYMAAGMSQDTGVGDFLSIDAAIAPTATAFTFYNFINSSSAADTARVFVAFHGDLA